ncbi:double-strand break repair helicase AddA [Microvirga antarctica]|uniref:double-strand break repair helicase AddA n=1 Tax=Microvirga antarctica TaxID=2819233 RepID=UPI001B3087C9|nr:double-strand break repair helicase AddA [Microvirga antarctica]
MRSDLVIPDYTREAQRRAADPRASAWVSANAGAGKTKVLTDRVVRLLLDGCAPGRILCLTFTKAAAANMAIRVFELLGKWVTLDDEDLVTELTELEGRPPTRAQVRLARTLFARAVETPGGLKIDTIHAFCERLLHLVPFEANVPARFSVLDENQTAEMLATETANVLADSASGAYPQLHDALAIVSVEAAGDKLSAALSAALRCKAFLRQEGGVAVGLNRLRGALGLGHGEDVATVEHAMLEGGIPPAEWLGLAAELRTGKATDEARASGLSAAFGARAHDERLAHYLDVFFTKDRTPRKSSAFLTKAVPLSVTERMLAEQTRLVGLQSKAKAALALQRTAALFTLAAEIGARVDQAKARHGALDFQDLIDKTLALLSRGDAAWVLYKLDRGIDHVLVDEAQDTNPEQWEILDRITADFTAGAGAGGTRVRTLFAVGDPKQSIYGFQGADPQEFEASRKKWKRKLDAAELAFADVRLTLSFRSTPAVLSAVDATFAVESHFRGLSFEDQAIGTVHESARPQVPGLVELWPVVTPQDEDEPDAWVLPVDAPEQHAPPVVVAGRIADLIKRAMTIGDETGRLWRAGEVLVLVRKRGAAFEAVIRALKEKGVPVAGADRLNIGEHIAVMDLVAAGRAALLPNDDLTLATALKSPLVGLTDDDLIRIASSRGDSESLLAALERHALDRDPAAARACESLRQWRELARERGPFGFFAFLLGPLRGRARLVARLGSEAGDAIDAFLSAAHQSEALSTPSLVTFLDRFESADHTIKRDLESTNDEVRVMTVHGAKGLEAPIVILFDGCTVRGADPVLLQVPTVSGRTLPVWSPGKAYDSDVIAAARAVLHDRAMEEHNRLLYVAMTRAKDRLVVAPYLTAGKTVAPQAWSEMIRLGLGLKPGALEDSEGPFGPVSTWRDGPPATPGTADPTREDVVCADVPGWLAKKVVPEPEPLPPIRPSSALGAADRLTRPGDGPYAPEARLRGTIVHALIERLPDVPPEHRHALALGFVKARAPRLAPSLRDAFASHALSVLQHPDLAPLFAPGSRAEAPIAGQVLTSTGTLFVSGQMDRLAVRDTEVLVADFKTTARPPREGAPVPAAYVTQMALYRALLQEIYPDKRVRAFLVWTAGPVVHELQDGVLDAALSGLNAA